MPDQLWPFVAVALGLLILLGNVRLARWANGRREDRQARAPALAIEDETRDEDESGSVRAWTGKSLPVAPSRDGWHDEATGLVSGGLVADDPTTGDPMTAERERQLYAPAPTLREERIAVPTLSSLINFGGAMVHPQCVRARRDGRPICAACEPKLVGPADRGAR